MLSICASFIALFASVYSYGDFTILENPESIVFKGHEPLKESLLADVFSAALSFTIEQDSNWNGMYLKDPFHLPESVIVAFVEGITSIDELKGHHYALYTDEDEGEIYHTLYKRIEERYPSGKSHIFQVDLSDGVDTVKNLKIFGTIKDSKPISYSELNPDIEEDRLFIKEINLIHNIADKVASGIIKPDTIPDLYWYKVSSLHSLSDFHGENSTTIKKAKQLLNDALQKLADAYKKAYDGKILFTVIASDTAHTRRIREAPPSGESADENLNLAKTYNADYPVIFNIILWFGVIMVFTLLAISMFIANMDPGRDSIIYRMTSTRIKKEN